ncbi:hypothetical protein EVAR_40531_1 [Eumeta japonica]|uniref:Uncharacterized protein n=1 Tax=Eumeta variegata TaxID=151549 RepID=A0A4C1XXD2_EUMVA|nr:hypothetical protein EVAR_40531_1 [Eumeta japonica]
MGLFMNALTPSAVAYVNGVGKYEIYYIDNSLVRELELTQRSQENYSMKLLASGLANNLRPLVIDVSNVRAGGVTIYDDMDDNINIITQNIDMTVRQAELTSSTVTSVGVFCAAKCKMEDGTKIMQWMCETPIFGYPSGDKEFVVDTESGNPGIGAVLPQFKVDRRVVTTYSASPCLNRVKTRMGELHDGWNSRKNGNGDGNRDENRTRIETVWGAV